MKKTLIFVIIIAILGGGYYISHRHKVATPAVQTVSGSIKYVAASAGTVTLETTDGAEATLALEASSKIYDESGAEASINDLKPDMSITATGSTTPTSIIVSSITIVSRPVGGTDISGPCPGVLDETVSSITCSMPITSRITISLPSASYAKSKLSIDPVTSFGETFGASTQDSRWIRTFQALQPGTVTITAPSSSAGIPTFKATITIFGVATSTDTGLTTASSTESNANDASDTESQ